MEEYAYPKEQVTYSTPVEEQTDDSNLPQTAWGNATVPESHPQVMATRFSSPIVEASDNKNVWWDEENHRVHKQHDFKGMDEMREYAMSMAALFKDGTVNMRSLPISNKLAVYAIKQQLDNGDVNFDKPSIFDIKG